MIIEGGTMSEMEVCMSVSESEKGVEWGTGQKRDIPYRRFQADLGFWVRFRVVDSFKMF
jgi:hypothetical protein